MLNRSSAFGRENKFQDEFLAKLREHGAYAVSITGNIYQSGQPDISCESIYGAHTKVELKVYRGLEVPDRTVIIKLLRGPQINVITNQLWRRKSNCIIIAQIGATPDKVCIVSRQRHSFDTVENCATILARLKYGEYTPYE